MVAPFMIRLLPFAVAFAAVSTSASAGMPAVSGTQLFESCEGSTSYDIGDCLGYVTAISDILSAGSIDGLRACEPAKITSGQIRDVVLKELTDHPDARDGAASSLAAKALAAAYPCGGKK